MSPTMRMTRPISCVVEVNVTNHTASAQYGTSDDFFMSVAVDVGPQAPSVGADNVACAARANYIVFVATVGYMAATLSKESPTKRWHLKSASSFDKNSVLVLGLRKSSSPDLPQDNSDTQF
jgi:hypothetical protein